MAYGVPPLVVLLFALVGLTGCNSCKRQAAHHEEKGYAGCASAEDCVDLDPCMEVECIDARCIKEAAPRGTPCGEASACRREPRCDAQGRCVAGEPIRVGDGNPCTEDFCDPVRGVINKPIDVDDGDACTLDACDPRTGEITHESIDLDDSDECTFDTCNPETGVSHARAEPKYTCETSCGPGYHLASRRPSPSCPRTGLQSFCQPDCSPSFYTCEDACPRGYRAGTRHVTTNCGPDQPMTFCTKE